jgi:hypothetical protein
MQCLRKVLYASESFRKYVDLKTKDLVLAMTLTFTSYDFEWSLYLSKYWSHVKWEQYTYARGP